MAQAYGTGAAGFIEPRGDGPQQRGRVFTLGQNGSGVVQTLCAILHHQHTLRAKKFPHFSCQQLLYLPGAVQLVQAYAGVNQELIRLIGRSRRHRQRSALFLAGHVRVPCVRSVGLRT